MAGVQRVKTLGASGGDNQAVPQDGIEVLRRMCRWIVDDADPSEDEASSSSSPELCEERESVVPGMSMANERSSGFVTVGQLDPKRGAIL